uniref:Uncharacterized protein LOC111123319 n=1 Tax=Crassostrea virginica TaxID=6565 RepID=A0A8B8CZG8_CRAVI|nr:uncharacterized protein LOC111123319 [Crassostrea virginica]
MDPEYIPQDLVRCGLCETPVPPKHCDICHINLCKACVGEHLSDESIEHRIVPFRKRGLTVQCENHARKICELHCKQCNIPICALCVSTGEHDQHKKEDILKTFARNIEVVQKDLGELETVISPKYENAAFKILAKEAYFDENFKKLTKALQKQGRNWHREIDTIILILQSNIDDMYSENVAACHEYQDKLIHSIDEISEIIVSLKTLLDTRDVSDVPNYKSRIGEFGTIPKEPSISQLTFQYKRLRREKVFKEFGLLSYVPDLLGASTKPPDAVPLSLNILFLDNPWIITEIRTAYPEASLLHSVSCLTDDEFWVCSGNSILRLYNLQGKLLQSVQTVSGNWPWDIAVTRSGDFIYTDPDDRSINVVSKTHTYPLIRLEGWKPCGVCCTYDDDILVIMVCDAYKQTKVVRYSDSKAIQSIQWDLNSVPLYSSGLT